MNWMLQIPLELRYLLLFLIGLVAGGQVNWAIYCWAWNVRWISPWSRPARATADRRWPDRLPVYGWWRLRRESAWHGPGFWLRPLLIELGLASAFVLLYWWEVVQVGLYPRDIPPPPPLQLHVQYFAHVILLCGLTIATFIDFDEQTIPDLVTMPGTIIGLLLAAVSPFLFPPHYDVTGEGALRLAPLYLVPPQSMPAWLLAWQGLALALLGWSLWLVVLLDGTCTLRRGWRRGWIYFWVSIYRRGSWTWKVPLSAAGVIVLVAAWSMATPMHWVAAVTSLTGILFGGGLIWMVRLIGRAALRVEAMGFGDVTLMGMIGAFLGWQPTIIVFFLAPVTAVVIAICQWLATRQNDIAFGPYLALAAMVLITAWRQLWLERIGVLFLQGWLVPSVVVVCLILMGLMLWLWRLFRDAVFPG